ncbi:hypothetical protein CIW49_13500 [Mycolicibacterium sp. P1-18]|uniref:hypothetical protein n=1 Tax=Mycolicibacterium sp. P1-18 TaxID=2024615 RepID=UPI0011F0DCEB|nr:hypothetical protein [Mycolicibacterium sp. P1-18]KAA0098888.1 hypothetical protein CIW49_13500 [Mycolicibacterium sp. P1-18]
MPYDKDGNSVSLANAMELYVPVAFEELKQTAQTYGAFMTYKQLGDYVTTSTGIGYDATYRWVGGLLGPIVWMCVEQNLPPLTSLVVNSHDQSVGEGYAENFRASGLPVPEGPDRLDILDDHAAASRLECYRFFGAELPFNGGIPMLTPRIKAARDVKRLKAKAEAPPKLCPVHRTVLPTTGRCDDCE